MSADQGDNLPPFGAYVNITPASCGWDTLQPGPPTTTACGCREGYDVVLVVAHAHTEADARHLARLARRWEVTPRPHPRAGLRTVDPAEVLNAATEGDG